MDKKIHIKKVTVSKSRNIASFVLNIISTSFFGIATILFLVSAFVIKWPGDSLDHISYSSFGIGSDATNIGIMFATIGYLLFIWARALRSQHKMASAKLLTLNIITSVFLFLGAILIIVASPAWSSFPLLSNTLQDFLDNHFACSIAGVVFLGTGLIMAVIFDHIFYQDSLGIIALPICIIVLQLVSVIFDPLWGEATINTNHVQKIIVELAQCGAIILVWALITKLICGELINNGAIRYKVGHKLAQIFFGIFMGVFITFTILSVAEQWVRSSILANSIDWLRFGSGILFAGYISGLTVSVSSGIYLNQASARSLA